MLKRKMEQTLIEWKNTPGHKPLIIKGCRQCGKTFSVRSFAESNYEHVVYLNFYSNPDYASIFSGSLEVNHLIMMMSALLGPEASFEAGKTIIILDELQECPDARTALKFFQMDGRFDVVGTGSLLGVKGYGREPKSIPVGYETVIDMYPMDFEEFLWACGITPEIIKLKIKALTRQGTKITIPLNNSSTVKENDFITFVPAPGAEVESTELDIPKKKAKSNLGLNLNSQR